MKYYRYQPDADNFAGIGFPSTDTQQIVDVHSSDVPLASDWSAITAHGFEDNPEQQGDFPSLSNFCVVPVMRRRAWRRLQPLIGYCCEALPIICAFDQSLSIIHVMDTVDALDTQKSEVKRYFDGRIMRIIRYSLKDTILRGKHIFKLPRQCGGELLVDHDFRQAVEANGLRGLLFEQLPMVD